MVIPLFHPRPCPGLRAAIGPEGAAGRLIHGATVTAQTGVYDAGERLVAQTIQVQAVR